MENDNSKSADQSGEKPQQWGSLEQWENDPKFREAAEREFLTSPFADEELANPGSAEGGWARREFLKLMGASIALGTAGCIRRPVETVIPYANRPPEIVPGLPDFYASSWTDTNGDSFGLLVTTREGRPIKIEGNTFHPMNKGGLSARANAHILSLYDPERLKNPQHNLLDRKKTASQPIDVSWESLDKDVVAALKNGSAVLLTCTIPSPSTMALVSEFVKAYNLRHVVWEPFAADAIMDGQKDSYGHSVLPRYNYENTRMVVSIDADFLGTHLTPVTAMRHWNPTRKIGKNMARLVSFESMLSLTGVNADDRYRIRPSQQLDVVMGLLSILVSKYKVGDASLQAMVSPFANVASSLQVDPKDFESIADELWNNRGQSLVVAGGITTRTAREKQLHAAVNLLNSLLQNDGKVVDYQITTQSLQGSYKDMASLINDMAAGKVKTVIIHGINPVYSMPSDSGFIEALRKVPTVVYTGDRIDETGKASNYIAVDNHPLENWGDLEAQTGIFSIQQPTIRPLYNTRSFQDSMLSWIKASGKVSADVKAADTWHTYLKNRWNSEVYKKTGANGWKVADFEDFWVNLLQNGVYDLSAKFAKLAHPRTANAAALKGAAPVNSPAQYELQLYPTIGLADGSLANVAWLQEFPDPITKICWDNYLNVSPATAHKEGLEEGDIVVLQVGNKKVEAPIHIQVGHHDNVLSMAVGYGRTRAGDVGNSVGINAYNLASFNNGEPIYSGLPASFKKTGNNYGRFANVQHNNRMQGRQLAVEATLATILKDPNAGIERKEIFSIWPKKKYTGHKWAMTVDLNSCTGCGACMVACMSENNIPTVGKTLVKQGREMWWLRVDRYHMGSPANPDSINQPVPCQQCDNAPCETVCPVLATMHDQEGLNVQVYNRCVGTRYCSNNCPYKVRRFNWFNYMKLTKYPQTLAYNPQVTVRPRGVMEKCTFCIQRIKYAELEVLTTGNPYKDGEIMTACQQTCPADALVFGDMNDPDSRVSKLFKEQRAYKLLAEFNAEPAVRYLAKARNSKRPEPPNTITAAQNGVPSKATQNLALENHPVKNQQEGHING